MSPETRLNGLHFCRRQYGSIFIHFFCGGFRKTHLFWNRMRFGRSRLSKVVDFGTNRKGVCNFLLVISSNFGPVLHRFWDMVSYWLKIANFSYPTLVSRPRSGGTLSNFWMKLTEQKLEGWGYCMVKTNPNPNPNYNRFCMNHPCDRQTDGRTDGRNCDSICALTAYMLSRAKTISALFALHCVSFCCYISLPLATVWMYCMSSLYVCLPVYAWMCVCAYLLFRPPGTLVPGGLMFYHRCFFFIFSPRDLWAPSADRRETLPHDRNMGALYNASPKIRGALPQRNWGPKTCKIRRNFIQLQNSIANVSGTDQDIQNRKTYFSPAIPATFYEKSPVNFGPLTTENCMWVWTHPNCIFRETIFRPLGGTGPSNFNTHYRLTKAC